MEKDKNKKETGLRSESIYIRLTQKEKLNLERYAKEHGLTRTRAIVLGIQRLIEEEREDAGMR